MKKINKGINLKSIHLNKKQKLYAIIIGITVVMAVIIAVVLSYFTNNKVIVDKNNKSEIVNEDFSFLLEYKSNEILNDDLYEYQYQANKKYMEKFKEEKFTLKKPYVIVDPYGISPQTALVMFNTPRKESVKVTIKGKHGDDFSVNFEKSKEHILPIYGLYGNYENVVVIETSGGSKKTLKIKVKEEAPTVKGEVKKNTLKSSNGEFYFMTSSLGIASVAYDNYGEIRWWFNMPYTKGITMLQNGNMLISSSNFGADITSTSGVVETDLLGNVKREYEIEGGYHHDAYELPNGNLIILTDNLASTASGDFIVEINRKTGKTEKFWDFAQSVLRVDKNFLEPGDIGWSWINSVYYDEIDNELILSVRNRNSIVSIDYDTGDIKWILGDKKYWNDKFEKYYITPIGDDFIYPMGQHSVNFNKDGNLTMFNNGYNAYKEKETACREYQNSESYAVEYKIDKKKKTAEVLWKFGGKEYFSYALSSYTYALNDHTVFNSGWHFGKKTDYNSDKCTQFTNDSYDTTIIELDKNKNVVVELFIDESRFETIKAPVYNLEALSVRPKIKKINENFKFEKGEYLSNYDKEEYKELTKEEALSYQTDSVLQFNYSLYNKRLKLIGYIPDDDYMKIAFISTKGKAYEFVYKEKDYKAKEFLNISSLPKGTYYLFCKTSDEVYNNAEYIVIS